MTEMNTDRPAERQSRAQLIGAVGRRIRDARMSTGALASLRRGSRHDVVRQAAFYAVLADLPDELVHENALQRWAAVAQCIALTGSPADSRASDGSVLAASHLSESRFARLLASHGDGFFDQLLLIARFLHSKDATPSWTTLGELALTDEVNEARADAVRLRLARDFYRTLTSKSAS